jgi:hypothetical protein
MTRPRVVTLNVASIDGRLNLAPGVSLMSEDERWTVMTEARGSRPCVTSETVCRDQT